MNPLVRIPPDVRRDQIYRETLLSQPPEFFRHYVPTDPTPEARAHLVEKLIRDLAAPNTYLNDTYCVRVRRATPFIHLDISRPDGRPVVDRDDFQRIKNQLVGPEHEAVQLYPADSRLVDTSNQYHLWVMPSRENRFPFG